MSGYIWIICSPYGLMVLALVLDFNLPAAPSGFGGSGSCLIGGGWCPLDTGCAW